MDLIPLNFKAKHTFLNVKTDSIYSTAQSLSNTELVEVDKFELRNGPGVVFEVAMVIGIHAGDDNV